MTPERLAIFDRLSVQEIVLALTQDTTFQLPGFSKDRRVRMAAARAAMKCGRHTAARRAENVAEDRQMTLADFFAPREAVPA